MPLDRTNGEVIEGLVAGPHVAIPTRLLAGMTNYRTPYQPPRKFVSRAQRDKNNAATRPVFEDAVANAIEAFAAKGALSPSWRRPEPRCADARHVDDNGIVPLTHAQSQA
ncbi:MAG TPA: hypothetical protein VNK48_14600 [Xanthobacteraceae bacterium]|nr:hypothetical protein [Xanthobacteraceae bacterium]